MKWYVPLTRLAVLVGVVVAQGCYTYVPVDTTSPPVGERLAFELTDRGRAALSERLGEGVLRVEGSLVQADSERYVMRVWGVSQIREGTIRWSGETVTIGRDFVGGVERRQLATTRTWLLAGATTGVLLYAMTQDLVGGGREQEDPGGDDPPQQAIIWNWK